MRQAVEADIPRLVEMGRDFHEAATLEAPFDADCFSDFLSQLIGGAGVVFVTDGGFIGGVLSSAYFASSWVMAVELFWWSTDGQGMPLLRKFESWAEENGASEVRMTTITNLPRADRILRLKGYRPVEISYERCL